MEYFLGRLNEQLSDQSQFKPISGLRPLDGHAAPPLRLTPGDLCYFWHISRAMRIFSSTVAFGADIGRLR